MSLPSEVTIEGIVYEITQDENRVPVECWENLGRTQASDCLIWINTKKQHPQQLPSSLLHEIMHVLYWHTFCGPHVLFENAHDQEEFIVGLFDVRLINIMRTNPAVHEFIFGQTIGINKADNRTYP